MKASQTLDFILAALVQSSFSEQRPYEFSLSPLNDKKWIPLQLLTVLIGHCALLPPNDIR